MCCGGMAGGISSGLGAGCPGAHKKGMHAIAACRTGELGTVLYQCESCGQTHAMGRSCGNRHCPTCQQGKTKAWLCAKKLGEGGKHGLKPSAGTQRVTKPVR